MHSISKAVKRRSGWILNPFAAETTVPQDSQDVDPYTNLPRRTSQLNATSPPRRSLEELPIDDSVDFPVAPRKESDTTLAGTDDEGSLKKNQDEFPEKAAPPLRPCLKRTRRTDSFERAEGEGRESYRDIITGADDYDYLHPSEIKGLEKVYDDNPSFEEKCQFIIRLSEALMSFGSPANKLEGLLVTTALTLNVEARFLYLAGSLVASFDTPEGRDTITHIIKFGQRLDLGKILETHKVYRLVNHRYMTVEKGLETLGEMLYGRNIYSIPMKIFFAFCCCSLICPMAFGGSFADMWLSGLLGTALATLQLHILKTNPLYASVFEVTTAIVISFVARGLSSIRAHVFCYEAVSTSGVVLILPGFSVLMSSMELASKNILSGSVRMVSAMMYSLFLGFGLTLGSDLYLILDQHAMSVRTAHGKDVDYKQYHHGSFLADNNSLPIHFSGTMTFFNDHLAVSKATELVCSRGSEWPWWKQSFPWWSLFLLVPAFAFFSSLWNYTPIYDRHMPAMVLIACAAFTTNLLTTEHLVDRNDVISALGAFIIGILGNLYARLFNGTAFVVMITGICFLIPTGIAATGGLANNYVDEDIDQYTTGLSLGFRMIQVGIGISVGLFTSGLVVYSFGKRKKGSDLNM